MPRTRKSKDASTTPRIRETPARRAHEGNGQSRRRATAKDAHAYPRPQLVREQWINLNGLWEFAIDADTRACSPKDVTWTGQQIRVPFAPETPASGVNDTGLYQAVWYRRTFARPEIPDDHRVLLHFGAVDYDARVWVNDRLAVRHEGGYTPFDVDITDLLVEGDANTITVAALDDPLDLSKPRGKQDWLPQPHSIWYYRTTGIWQTVWMEVVPRTRIASIRWTSNIRRWDISLYARIHEMPSEMSSGGADEHRLRIRLSKDGRTLADDTCLCVGGEVVRTICMVDPGIDDARNALMWWPWSPNLIDVELELSDAGGNVVDRAASYTAMRSVSLIGDRFVMNGRPLYLSLVLDQGYWPTSGLTAPDDDALRRDVELAKQMGFNGVRKHQKIEDPRYLYWADRLGLMVWEEMPSAYRFDDRTVQRLTREWIEVIKRDISHPCIICWVPLNESWGVPDLPYSESQRSFVRSLYYLTKTPDSTRPVIGNDGWENIATDIIAIHDYDSEPKRIADRYTRDSENLFKLFTHERPGHKVLLLDGLKWDDKPVMLTEFGGIAFSKDTAHTWGYRRAKTAAEFKQQFTDLVRTVRGLPLLAGFCYTQFTDTYQEANGLLYMDRTPKFPLKDIAAIVSG